jgi:hypothetical protein
MLEAAAHLRRNREGVLLADNLAIPVRFVVEGEAGRIVFPADGTIMGAEELVLFVPGEAPENDNELQLLLSAGLASESAADRWRAYHGQPTFQSFGSFAIEDSKFDGVVVEAAISGPSPLVPIEGRLCKRLNADRARLAKACLRISGVEVKEPLAVGVDGHGVDVRARFGIVRIEFADPVDNQASAEWAIDELLGGGS